MTQSPRERLTRTSMSLAVLAIFSTLTFPVVLPYIFGSVSLMLAIISKGARHSFPRRSRTAVIVASVALALNTALIVSSALYFLRALHEMNMKVTLNLHPALGVRWFEKQYREMAERMGVDPDTKAPVRFNIADPDFINAYFDILHKPYERDGVDFWWIDWQQGTGSSMAGLDPLWSLNHYHTLDIAKEHEALILSRYAGIGSHRYPLGFSGDTLMTWKSQIIMAPNPIMTAHPEVKTASPAHMMACLQASRCSRPRCLSSLYLDRMKIQ